MNAPIPVSLLNNGTLTLAFRVIESYWSWSVAGWSATVAVFAVVDGGALFEVGRGRRQE
jgi:hypothetical protein